MKVQTCISLRKAVLNAGRAVAASHNRSFSNQLEQWIEEKLSESSKKKGSKRA